MKKRFPSKCSTCGVSLGSEQEERNHVFYNEFVAGRHGYSYVGDMRMHQALDAYPFPRAVDAIPSEIITTYRDKYFTFPQATNLYAMLHGLWIDSIEPVDAAVFATQRNVSAEVILWLRRILLDEEALAVYLMIHASDIEQAELLNRLADLFDLPKFWEMP